jgi:hypothetical protein
LRRGGLNHAGCGCISEGEKTATWEPLKDRKRYPKVSDGGSLKVAS